MEMVMVPINIQIISESQGLRNGPDYRDGVVYYPIDGEPPYKSIVLTPDLEEEVLRCLLGLNFM